jgi:hypothetical protein
MTEIDPDKLLSLTKAAAVLGVAPTTASKMLEPVRVSESGRKYYTLRSIRDQLAQTVGGAA